MNTKSLGILGTKLGMTRIFGSHGKVIPVTLIQAGPCHILQVKTKEKDGYNAVKLGFGSNVKEKNLAKPYVGIFKKNNLPVCKWIREFRLNSVEGYKTGDVINVDIFKEGDYVDVCGTMKGKGFAGVVKRHNFGGGPRTHGQSDRLRAVGSIGAQGPQRVVKGKRMPGHMGDVTRTIMRLLVAKVVPEKQVLMVNGSVPGVNNNLVMINKTVKSVRQAPVIKIEKKIPGKGKAPEQKAAPKKK